MFFNQSPEWALICKGIVGRGGSIANISHIHQTNFAPLRWDAVLQLLCEVGSQNVFIWL